MRAIVVASSLMVVCTMLAQSPAVPSSTELEIRQIPRALMSAWDQADSKAMSSLFAAESDLVIPSGDVVTGRQAIQGFYHSVFERGYRGSHASAEVRSVRVTGLTAIVDGSWSISGAKDETGAPRPSEHGLFTAVLSKQGDKWYVTALREMVPR